MTRRAAIAAGGAAAVGALAAGLSARQDGARAPGAPDSTSVPPVAGLPERQHAWNAALRRDEHGNPQLPRHHRILLLDLAAPPTAAGGGARMEDALRTVDHDHPFGPDGVMALVAWGPAYFRAIGAPSPIPVAEPLHRDELPDVDDVACCLLLASDHEDRLAAVERSLLGDDGALRDLLRLRQRRTGFAGAGLPARAQREGGGLGLTRPIDRDAPLFMGFRSGLRRNQATEADVTIAEGPFAGGTTMHLSAIALELDSWYELSERDRVARMYAPQQTPAQVARFTDDAPAPPEGVGATADRHGRVGHTQALAAVRRNGRPLILRRDVNTIDDGGAGLHFVAYQRDIASFAASVAAMTAARSRRNPQLTGQLNNGINEWMRVTRRANFVVPPRRARSFPLLEGSGDA